MEFLQMVAYAEGEAAQTAQQPGAVGMIISMLPMILVVVLLYFIMIRPQRKKDKELRNMINAMKVGDKVTTIGGICGKVSKIKDNFVIIETGNIGTVDEKSYIKMERGSIKSVETKQSN